MGTEKSLNRREKNSGEVDEKGRKKIDGHFLNCTSSTHIRQSICNLCEITKGKTELQFKKRGPEVLRGVTVSLKFFNIWTNGFQLFTPLAVLLLKRYQKSWKLKILVLEGKPRNFPYLRMT